MTASTPRLFGTTQFASIFLVLLALGAALVGCTAPPAETATSIRAEALGRETRPPQAGRGSLLYLAPDDQDNLQLQLLPLAANKPITLTQAPYGIMDYDVSGDGQIIVYSAWREDNGTDLWAVQIDGQHNRLLVPCENAACGRIAWMVTDNQFTYERHEGPEAQGAAALWLFDWEKQATQPLTIDNAEAGINLTWSPDGSWTSYFLPDKGVITVVHREDGRKYDLPNSLSDPVAWDPTGKTLVALEIKPDGNQTLAHLVQLDLTSGDRREIGTPRMADRQPAWSPTGDWLAVTRRDWTGKYPSKTQMWVMRRDGTEARAVLDDPDHQYLSPVWSPDGRFLVVQRYSNEQVFVQPEVWMVELATGQSTQVLPSAGQVTWLP